jgi:hypothetical protein
VAGTPLIGFCAHEAFEVTCKECPQDRMIGLVGLQQHASWGCGATGAAGDLMEQLKGPLTRTQICA